MSSTLHFCGLYRTDDNDDKRPEPRKSLFWSPKAMECKDKQKQRPAFFENTKLTLQAYTW